MNGCRVKAVDAEANSLGYINLKKHPLAYIYIGNQVLELLAQDGQIPISFKVTVEPVEWARA